MRQLVKNLECGKRLSSRRRFLILRRDGFCCVYCGRAGTEKNWLEVDHIVPVSDRGPNNAGNLVTSCRQCNAGKTNSAATNHALEHAVAKACEENLKRLLRWRESHPEFGSEAFDADFNFLSENLPDPFDVTEEFWLSQIDWWRGPPMVSARLQPRGDVIVQ